MDIKRMQSVLGNQYQVESRNGNVSVRIESSVLKSLENDLAKSRLIEGALNKLREAGFDLDDGVLKFQRPPPAGSPDGTVWPFWPHLFIPNGAWAQATPSVSVYEITLKALLGAGVTPAEAIAQATKAQADISQPRKLAETAPGTEAVLDADEAVI